jgi:AraC-like DNA-binding protein
MLDIRKYTAYDPDEYASVIHGNQVDFVSVDPGCFSASVTWIKLGCVELELGEANLGLLAQLTPRSREPKFSFIRPLGAPALRNTTAIASDTVAFSHAGGSASIHALGSHEWASLSVRMEDVERVHLDWPGQDTGASPSICVLERAGPLMDRLREVERGIVNVTTTAPEMFAGGGMALGFEDEVMRILAAAIQPRRTPEKQWSGDHSRVLSRFHEFLEANSDRSVYIAELCNATGAPGRTLRTICHRYFGIGPQRYLYLRRMHLARKTLLRESCETNTVTNIAMKFGFWELGRFAVQYRGLFGESPGVTLRALPYRHLRPQPVGRPAGGPAGRPGDMPGAGFYRAA